MDAGAIMRIWNGKHAGHCFGMMLADKRMDAMGTGEMELTCTRCLWNDQPASLFFRLYYLMCWLFCTVRGVGMERFDELLILAPWTSLDMKSDHDVLKRKRGESDDNDCL